VFRYFERVKGYDLEDIKKEILTDQVKEMVSVLGSTGKYPNNDYQIVLKDNIVVTINKK